jgi:hypothetical protein
MKRKKLLPLVITAGAAVLMIAGYLVYSAVSGGDKEPAKTELFSAESIQQIDYSYKGEQLAFVKKEGVWAYAADGNFPLNTAYLRDMEQALTSVTATQEIKAGDEADYGLEAPVCIIKAAGTDGSVFECEVGDDNDTANVVYVRTGGRIYTLDISFSKVFRHLLAEMAKRQELLDIGASQARTFSLENEKGSFKLLQYPDGNTGAFKKLTWAYEDGSPADAEIAKELVSAVAGMRAQECVSYKPDAATLESYGLAKPTVTVGVTYEGGELTAQIGNKNADGLYYVWLPESKLVYTFEASVPELLMDTVSRDCVNRQVFPVEYSELKYAEVKAGGATVRLNFEDYGKAWDFYYALSSMRAEGIADKNASGEADVVVTAYTADQNTTHVIAFKKYNDDFYSTDFLGYVQLVNKRDVEDLLNILQA